MRRAAAVAVTLAVVTVGLVRPAAAPEPPDRLARVAAARPASGTARVVGVDVGFRLRLADGRTLRLAAVGGPEPAAVPAQLIAAATGRVVSMHPAAVPVDRYDRVVAHAVVVPGGAWLQELLVGTGAAWVHTRLGERALAAELLAAERAARAAGRGLWGAPRHRVLAPGQTARHLGRFRLVTGRVIRATRVRGTVYLNFGADWRRDFTVRLDRAAVRRLGAADLDPLALAGRLIRVRGWLVWRNGPEIAPTHPERLELIDDTVAAPE